jgi:sortase A
MSKSSRFLILILVLCATVVFSTTIVKALFYSPPDTEITVPQEMETATNPLHHPARLQIPSLDIDAKVQDVGINSKGNMGVPNNFTDVGWYKYGVVPGGPGSAVMAGHVDNGLSLPGVFKNLKDLKAGDDVYVERNDGTKLHFVVTGTRSYPYDDVPTEILFNPSGSVRLNLITCTGSWVKTDKTYDQRLVVFTRLAD